MAQEGLLGARHQKAHDVVADAGESFHLGLDEVCRHDVLEVLQVGLLTGHVVAPALGCGVHEDDLLIVHGDIKSMLSEPCAQPSSRTSMPLCFRYVRITSCDLSLMFFPWMSASSCWGSPPWRALWCGWRLQKSGSARDKSKTRKRLSFPRDACGSRKSFAALVRTRLWASLLPQDEMR